MNPREYISKTLEPVEGLVLDVLATYIHTGERVYDCHDLEVLYTKTSTAIDTEEIFLKDGTSIEDWIWKELEGEEFDD